jgi:hypothetical protein
MAAASLTTGMGRASVTFIIMPARWTQPGANPVGGDGGRVRSA